MAVYFKFSSWSHSNFDTIPLEPSVPVISVGELKLQIIKKKKLDKSMGMVLINAQSNEEYKEDTQLVPKNSSIIVKLVPLAQTPVVQSQPIVSKPAVNTVNQTKTSVQNKTSLTFDDDDFGPAPWEKPEDAKTQQRYMPPAPNSEEAKILDLINKASKFDVAQTANVTQPTPRLGAFPHKGVPAPSEKKKPPPGYICYRCGVTGPDGHYIYDCPTNGDPTFNVPKRIPTMHGVPKSFIVEQEGKGFELKPNEHAFTQLISVSGLTKDLVQNKQKAEIPKDLICPICKNMFSNAVLMPCCTESACDDCIRTTLIEKTNFRCPLCNKSCTPDDLLPNNSLRRAVESFKLGRPLVKSEDSSQPTTPPESSAQVSSPINTTLEVTTVTTIPSNAPRTPPPLEEVKKEPVVESKPVVTPPVVSSDTSDKPKTSSKPTSPTHDRDMYYFPPEYAYALPQMMPFFTSFPGYNAAYQMMSREEFLAEQDRLRRRYERSPDRRYRRSRSRSPRRRSRSPRRSPRRSRSPKRSKRSRSRSRDRKRKRSPDRKISTDDKSSKKTDERITSENPKLENSVPEEKKPKIEDSTLSLEGKEEKPKDEKVKEEKVKETKEIKEEKGNDKEKSKEKEKQREKEREKDKERDRERREKEKQREKEKERSRDKEREREKAREKEKKDKSEKDKKSSEKDKSDDKEKSEKSKSEKDKTKVEKSEKKSEDKSEKDRSEKKDKSEHSEKDKDRNRDKKEKKDRRDKSEKKEKKDKSEKRKEDKHKYSSDSHKSKH